MRPEIIIHIGPPKTATTSLQVALGEVSHPDFFYAGTFQPRTQNTGSLCQKLYLACSGQSDSQVNDTSLRCELDRLTDEGKTIFFSEEMFLLEQEHVSFEGKIARLREVLSGFNCRILISARRGKSALPSLYQEIFKSLPLRLQLDFAAFCRDRRAVCYNYIAVRNMLNKVGFNDVVIVEFEALSKGVSELGALTGCAEFKGVSVTLEKHNSGLLGRGQTERELPKVSLKNLMGFAVVRGVVQALNARKWPGYRGLANALDRVALRPSGKRNLLVPPDVVLRMNEAYEAALNPNHEISEPRDTISR